MRLRRVKQNRKSVFFDPLKRGKNAEKLRCGFTDGCIPIFYKFGIYKKVSTLPLLMSWSARGYSNNQLRHHSNRCYYHSYGCHYLPKVLAVVPHAHFFVVFPFPNLLKRAKRVCAPPRRCRLALWSVKTCSLNRLVLLASARDEDKCVIEDFINLVPIALFITYVFE